MLYGPPGCGKSSFMYVQFSVFRHQFKLHHSVFPLCISRKCAFSPPPSPAPQNSHWKSLGESQKLKGKYEVKLEFPEVGEGVHSPTPTPPKKMIIIIKKNLCGGQEWGMVQYAQKLIDFLILLV